MVYHQSKTLTYNSEGFALVELAGTAPASVGFWAGVLQA